jgi:hypothetical protein
MSSCFIILNARRSSKSIPPIGKHHDDMKTCIASKRIRLAAILLGLISFAITHAGLQNLSLDGSARSCVAVAGCERDTPEAPRTWQHNDRGTTSFRALQWTPLLIDEPPLWLTQFDAALTVDALRATVARATDGLPRLARAPAAEDISACVAQLSPPLQVACRHLRWHNQSSYNASWCPSLYRCVLWGAGTFSLRISSDALGQHARLLMDGVGRRGPQFPEECTPAKLASLFLAGGTSSEALLEQYNRRAIIQAADIARQELCLEELASNRGSVLDRKCSQDSHVVVNALFPHPCQLTATSRTFEMQGQSGSYVLPLSPMDVLSLLYRISAPAAGYNTRMSLLVFSGDSTVRESFLRLVHFVRHGSVHCNPRRGGVATQPLMFCVPFFDLPTWGDILYSVYSDGDAVRLFPSPFSGGSRKGPSEVAQYLSRGATGRDEAGKSGGVVLFSMLFLFSKRTSEPRKELWGPRNSRIETLVHVRLLVEGTLYWEPHRDQTFIRLWEQEAERVLGDVRVSHDTFPFVALLAHPKFELCRAGFHKFVPRREYLSEIEETSLPALQSLDVREGGLPRGTNMTSTFNLDKNEDVLKFVRRVAQRRAANGSRHSSADAHVWNDVYALDKSRLPWVPGVLPVDHIHLACRLLPARGRPHDPLVAQPSTLQQWSLIMSSGDETHTPHDLRDWAASLEALDAACGVILPDLQTPLSPRWKHAGGKKRSFGRFVNLATDGRRCLDLGNEVLLEALMFGMGKRTL